jgi:tetratricopeptide (TPR) repeat protein
MTSFQQAAEVAQQAKDNRAATFWVQAANSALAGGEFVKARSFIDAALIEGTLKGPEAGEAHLDRARALVAVGDLTKARTDLDAAAKLVPQDPLIWLLSASLARRTGDLDRARTDIADELHLNSEGLHITLARTCADAAAASSPSFASVAASLLSAEVSLHSAAATAASATARSHA